MSRHRNRRVMFIGNDMYGIVNMTIGLAQNLHMRGIDVTYYAGARFKSYVESFGVAFRDLNYPSTPFPLHTYSVCLSALQATYQFLTIMSSEEPDNIPDCVVTTFDGLPGIYLAEMLRIPVVVINPFDLNDSFWKLFWRHNSLECFRETIDVHTEKAMYEMYEHISSQLSNKYSLTLPPSLRECLFGGVVEYSRTERVDLIVNSRNFLGELAVNTYKRHYIGSMVRSSDSNIIKPLPVIGEVEIPLVYISLGTVYYDKPQFWNACFDAFCDVDVRVVLSQGLASVNRYPLPANFMMCTMAPQLQILNHADVYVCHGGMNSVHELIRYGVPPVLCPQGYDEYIVSDIMAARCGAQILNPGGLDVNTIRDAVIGTIENSSSIRHGLLSLRQCDIDAGGIERASAIVESLCRDA